MSGGFPQYRGLPLSLAGATAPARFVGGTVVGAPVSGTFRVGDFVSDDSGAIWVCAVAGSPGTWVSQAGSGGPPSGAAGGSLAGVYPNPSIAAGAVGTNEIANGSIVDADVNASAAIALSKLATIFDQRLLGNVSGGSAVPVTLSAAQVRTLLGLAPAPDVQVFVAGGTWTKPAGAYTRARILLIGGGGGGGSGRQGLVASGRSGGGAGNGGKGAIYETAIGTLGATEVVTVGAAGSGGAAQAGASTDGNAGTDGGLTSLGSLFIAQGGTKGVGGTAAATAANANQGPGNIPGGPAGSTSITAVASTPSGDFATGGGGAGGCLSVGNTAFAGSPGGAATTVGGTGGAATGVNGVDAADSTANEFLGGGGGGGGGANAGVGGTGGAGGLYGGGGGGGGASPNASNSGAGGPGKAGICIVICY